MVIPKEEVVRCAREIREHSVPPPLEEQLFFRENSSLQSSAKYRNTRSSSVDFFTKTNTLHKETLYITNDELSRKT